MKDKLVKHLKSLPKMAGVYYDDEALNAVRKNNTEKIALNEDTPTQGGNIEAYSAAIGNDKTAICEEYTMCQYMGSSALEFIGLQMLIEWNREGENSKKTVVLNKDLSLVGISNKAHPKTKNLIQILYIKSVANVLA